VALDADVLRQFQVRHEGRCEASWIGHAVNFAVVASFQKSLVDFQPHQLTD